MKTLSSGEKQYSGAQEFLKHASKSGEKKKEMAKRLSEYHKKFGK